jgi:hypothetical protein
MFVETRDDARGFFLHVWAKMRGNEAMEPLEALVAEVIAAHPEYHAVLADPQRALGDDVEAAGRMSNPFLHMGLHIALVEQLQTDRPPGITAVYGELLTRFGGAHAAEHKMMEYLADELWHAGQAGRPPDAEAYLRKVRLLIA